MDTYNIKSVIFRGGSPSYTETYINYTALPTDGTINALSGLTITLPTAVGIVGKTFNIKNGGTGIVIVSGNASETIDGERTQTLTQYDCLSIQANGVSNWIIY